MYNPIITRADAKKRGLPTYFPGSSCVNGHISERNTSSGTCIACLSMSKEEVLAARIRKRDKRRAINAAVSKAKKHGTKIISRKDAENAGLVTYFDGNLCSKKHFSERYVSNGRCVVCCDTDLKSWRENNRERYEEARRVNVRNRYANDIMFSMKIRTRVLIGSAIRKMRIKPGGKTEQILGCSWDEFRSHIERQFLKGMSWENRHLWHIDHIVAASDGATEAEIMSLNRASNLRPLWGVDNLKKSNKKLFLI